MQACRKLTNNRVEGLRSFTPDLDRQHCGMPCPLRFRHRRNTICPEEWQSRRYTSGYGCRRLGDAVVREVEDYVCIAAAKAVTASSTVTEMVTSGNLNFQKSMQA